MASMASRKLRPRSTTAPELNNTTALLDLLNSEPPWAPSLTSSTSSPFPSPDTPSKSHSVFSAKSIRRRFGSTTSSSGINDTASTAEARFRAPGKPRPTSPYSINSISSPIMAKKEARVDDSSSNSRDLVAFLMASRVEDDYSSVGKVSLESSGGSSISSRARRSPSPSRRKPPPLMEDTLALHPSTLQPLLSPSTLAMFLESGEYSADPNRSSYQHSIPDNSVPDSLAASMFAISVHPPSPPYLRKSDTAVSSPTSSTHTVNYSRPIPRAYVSAPTTTGTGAGIFDTPPSPRTALHSTHSYHSPPDSPTYARRNQSIPTMGSYGNPTIPPDPTSTPYSEILHPLQSLRQGLLAASSVALPTVNHNTNSSELDRNGSKHREETVALLQELQRHLEHAVGVIDTLIQKVGSETV